MKSFIKNVLLYMMPLLMVGGLLSGCEEDNEDGENPVIFYVRVTDPAASDSLLVESSLGNLIAIVGENLGGVRELWFNDRQAALNPAFITNRTILVTVPSIPPAEVTNKMVLKFGNGSELQHDFVIKISAPQVSNIKNERVPEGGEMVIRGEYFFDPIKVTFTGGAEGVVTSVKQNEVRVTVPEGAEPGPVTVQTNFGKAVTRQWYGDTRNVFADLEGAPSGWWHGHQYIVASDPNINPISGKFIRINRQYANWFEMLVAPANSNMATRNIPDDAIRNPSDYNLKFEINTLNPFAEETVLKFFIGANLEPNRHSENYPWKPGALDTKGEWETITIPFELIMANSKATVNSNGYAVSFFFQQGVPQHLNFGIDNFRVTPK